MRVTVRLEVGQRLEPDEMPPGGAPIRRSAKTIVITPGSLGVFGMVVFASPDPAIELHEVKR